MKVNCYENLNIKLQLIGNYTCLIIYRLLQSLSFLKYILLLVMKIKFYFIKNYKCIFKELIIGNNLLSCYYIRYQLLPINKDNFLESIVHCCNKFGRSERDRNAHKFYQSISCAPYVYRYAADHKHSTVRSHVFNKLSTRHVRERKIEKRTCDIAKILKGKWSIKSRFFRCEQMIFEPFCMQLLVGFNQNFLCQDT